MRTAATTCKSVLVQLPDCFALGDGLGRRALSQFDTAPGHTSCPPELARPGRNPTCRSATLFESSEVLDERGFFRRGSLEHGLLRRSGSKGPVQERPAFEILRI